jgi:putative redox protein
MAHAIATIGTIAYAVSVTAGEHPLTVDESAALGGRDAGPAPYDLLLASLGACTAITLKMYADRKQWRFESLQVALHYKKEGDRGLIDRTITIQGDLTAEQRTRMAEIAEKTPVTLTLKAGVDIHTETR